MNGMELNKWLVDNKSMTTDDIKLEEAKERVISPRIYLSVKLFFATRIRMSRVCVVVGRGGGAWKAIPEDLDMKTPIW
jgi:hypothetical protein